MSDPVKLLNRSVSKKFLEKVIKLSVEDLLTAENRGNCLVVRLYCILHMKGLITEKIFHREE